MDLETQIALQTLKRSGVTTGEILEVFDAKTLMSGMTKLEALLFALGERVDVESPGTMPIVRRRSGPVADGEQSLRFVRGMDARLEFVVPTVVRLDDDLCGACGVTWYFDAAGDLLWADSGPSIQDAPDDVIDGLELDCGF